MTHSAALDPIVRIDAETAADAAAVEAVVLAAFGPGRVAKTAERVRDRTHPLTISHGFGEGFEAEFDWVGTLDPTPWLCIPECIRFFNEMIPDGWNGVMIRNQAMALTARARICNALAVAEPCPASMVGAMASIPLPECAPGSPAARLDHEQLMHWFGERGIETWFFPWSCPGGKLLRISAQLYNHEGHYERLIDRLREAMAIDVNETSPSAPRATSGHSRAPHR